MGQLQTTTTNTTFFTKNKAHCVLPDQGHQDSPARLIRGHMLDSVFVHMVDNKLQQLLPMTHNLGWANYKLQQLTPRFFTKNKAHCVLPDQGHQDSPARLIRGHMLDSVFVHVV